MTGKPIFMGVLMGAIMLAMLHLMLSSDSLLAGWALAGFVAVHGLVLAIGAATAIWAARLSPRLRVALSRLHRPGLAHVTQMIAAGGATALALHIVLHGGI